MCKHIEITIAKGEYIMIFPYIWILAAATAWGSIGVVGEILFLYNLTPEDFIWFRAAVAFAVILLMTLVFDRSRLHIHKQHLPVFIAYGLVSVALFYLSYMTAIDQTGVAMAAILLYTAPAMVVILSRLFFKESVGKIKILSIILTIVGSFFVVKGYDLGNLRLNTSGILWGLLSGFTYALYSIFGKSVADKYHPWTIILYSQGFGTLFLTTMFFPSKMLTTHQDPKVWLALVYLGIVPTLFAYICYNAALKYVAPGSASIIATWEPVAAVIFGYVLLGQLLEPIQMLGAMLVITAVFIVQLIKPSKKSLEPQIKKSWFSEDRPG